MSESIVILGAGLCGARAAFGLREKGFNGNVTLIGSEVHAPYDRPPLSKQSLHSDPQLQHIAHVDSYGEAGIERLSGVEVVDIDRPAHKVILASGQAITYDKLLIATGASARCLPNLASDNHVLTLRTHDDAIAIRGRLGPGRSVIIVGGGFIGLELAATARSIGTNVTVVEGQPRLMARAVPAEIADVVERRHRQEGVEILLNTGVTSVVERADAVVVTLSNGRELSADFIVVGIGAVPNTGVAERAGLAIDNGIAVDRFLTTSDPDIFAAGDCCSFPLAVYGDVRMRMESWRCAQDQGILAARNLLGAREPFVGIPWFWSDQYDLTLQMAGLASFGKLTVRRDIGHDAFLLFHLDDSGKLVAASGIGVGNMVGRDIKLAEMLIAAGARPDPAALSDASVKLKSLLAA